MKKILFILFLMLFWGCNYKFDDLDIIFLEISVSTSANKDQNEHNILVQSYVNGADRIYIKRRGHCFVFDSNELPDTTDNVANITLPSDNFSSKIPYGINNNSIVIRGFITFGDSIIYSEKILLDIKK